MKNNQWNPPTKESNTNVATMPAPMPIKNDAAFDKLRYQPTPRAVTAPTPVARAGFAARRAECERFRR